MMLAIYDDKYIYIYNYIYIYELPVSDHLWLGVGPLSGRLDVVSESSKVCSAPRLALSWGSKYSCRCTFLK